jgi:hypothetical protein
LNARRYLCSQLIELRCGGSSLTVNLEEIWETGAVLESDENVPTHVPADLQSGAVTLCGRLTTAEKHAFGWRLEMEFSPLTPWSPERFRPAHLLDPSTFGHR